ncbi:MAG TPA: hypothetical protein VJT09_05670 [Pyrinomonadaceae bacterium]|nr:hypothetical protein [Pyrinomonadaceae bacterium]
MSKRPRLGSESFWDMAALAIEGWLASCQSCVEHYYYQSWENAVVFLDSCAAGGLVEKVSLLDLKGDVGPRPAPTLWQKRYDQNIYISAPVFRKGNLDAARRRIEGTKNAVYNAFRLYYEELGADNDGINAAYMHAVVNGDLRHSDIARERLDVDLSPVAKLRLIQDGRLTSIKRNHTELSPSEVRKQVTKETIEYVLRFSGQKVQQPCVSDRAEELEKFVVDFLGDQCSLGTFLQEGYKLRSDYHLRLLPVIRELTYYLYGKKKKRNEDAAAFIARIREKIDGAKQRQESDEDYVIALSEFREDLDDYVSGRRSPIFAPTPDANHLGPPAIA